MPQEQIRPCLLQWGVVHKRHPQVQAVHSLQGETKGDRVLNAFFQNRGEIPRGGVSMRLRAESALPTSPIGGSYHRRGGKSEYGKRTTHPSLRARSRCRHTSRSARSPQGWKKAFAHWHRAGEADRELSFCTLGYRPWLGLSWRCWFCSPLAKPSCFRAVPEREANEIIAILARSEINASKKLQPKTTEYQILVDEADFSSAVGILSRYGYPRRSHENLGQIFQPSGLGADSF